MFCECVSVSGDGVGKREMGRKVSTTLSRLSDNPCPVSRQLIPTWVPVCGESGKGGMGACLYVDGAWNQLALSQHTCRQAHSHIWSVTPNPTVNIHRDAYVKIP